MVDGGWKVRILTGEVCIFRILCGELDEFLQPFVVDIEL